VQIHDIRESRVYQDAVKEGMEKATVNAITKMAAKKMLAKEIAAILELELEFVRKVLKNLKRK